MNFKNILQKSYYIFQNVLPKSYYLKNFKNIYLCVDGFDCEIKYFYK